MPNLARCGSATLNERNRTKSSATNFLTNGTELKVPLQKVSEPTPNRRGSSLILWFPKSSRNCTNERPALQNVEIWGCTTVYYRSTSIMSILIAAFAKTTLMIRTRLIISCVFVILRPLKAKPTMKNLW